MLKVTLQVPFITVVYVSQKVFLVCDALLSSPKEKQNYSALAGMTQKGMVHILYCLFYSIYNSIKFLYYIDWNYMGE